MKHRRKQRGVALIICLFALVLLSGIGLGMMYMADTETTINGNFRDSQRAYFAAAGGLQEARERLMPGSATGLGTNTPTTLPGGGVASGVTYVVNYTSSIPQNSIHPWDPANTYFDDEFCKEGFVSSGGSALVSDPGQFQSCTAVPTGTPKYVASNSPFLGANNNLAYRWIRVTLKANNTPGSPYFVGTGSSSNTVPICWDGTQETPNPSPTTYATCDDVPITTGSYINSYMRSVYVLTSLAVVPNSNARRMVQMEVANDPPFITNAALDTDDFVNVHGSSVTVNGFDNCRCRCTIGSGSHPPVCTDRTTGASCTGTTYSIYSSSDIDTSGNPALVAGTSPPYRSNVSPFPYDQAFIQALIDKYSTQTGAVNITGSPYNLTCSSGSPFDNCGSLTTGSMGTPPTGFPTFDPSNPTGLVNQITYVPGSLDLQAQYQRRRCAGGRGRPHRPRRARLLRSDYRQGHLDLLGGGSGKATNVIGSDRQRPILRRRHQPGGRHQHPVRPLRAAEQHDAGASFAAVHARGAILRSNMNRTRPWIIAAALLCTSTAVISAQSDQPSLADVARRKSAHKAKVVITNDDIPPVAGASTQPPSSVNATGEAAASGSPTGAAKGRRGQIATGGGNADQTPGAARRAPQSAIRNQASRRKPWRSGRTSPQGAI